jgi:uncharacterized membrane protein
MRFISKHILTGLVAVLPVVLTAWLLYWAAVSTEQLLGALLQNWLPPGLYLPGMGTAVALAVLFLIGLLLHAYVVRRLFEAGNRWLYRVPVFRSVYGAIRDFFVYFSPQGQREFDQVVSVEVAPGMHIVGFVTCAETAQLPGPLQGDDNLLVYLPLSYAIGGYTVALPASRVQALSMNMEEAMRFTLTGGVTGNFSGMDLGA